METFAADICRDCGRKEGNYSDTKLVSCNSCHELSCQHCLFTQGCAWCQKTETFNTQLSDTNTMHSEDTSDSRPFFNPKGIEPYDLSEQPSGSEVSYSSENWRDHMDDWEEYESKLIEEQAKLEKAIHILVGTEVHATVDKRLDEIRKMLNCRCDGYETCNACVSEWRRNRYGRDTHNVDCVCNDCSGNSRQYAESFSAESPEIWVLQEQTRHGTTVSLHNAMLPSQPYLEEFDGNVEDFEEGEFGWNGYFGNDWFYISCTKETLRSAESFSAESKFDKLSKKVAASYMKKGMSAKEAKRIGDGTAANIGRRKYGKAGMARKAKAGRKAETFSAELKRDSCCCGATKSKPCACMYEGVMKCSATAPMCPCYKALAKKAEDETIVDSQETKGITANTKQYKDYDYDIPKMIATIDEPVRNAVDTDDKKHELIGAFKAGGVFLAAMVLASGYNKYKNRN